MRVLDDLDSSHEPRGRGFDRCHMCGYDWHGLPYRDCSGYIAREDAIDAFMRSAHPAAHRKLLRALVDMGFYAGPEDHLKRILDGRPLLPIENDQSLWTIRVFRAQGVIPRVRSELGEKP